MIVRRKRFEKRLAACEAVGVPFSQAEVAMVYQSSFAMKRLVQWLALSFRVVTYRPDGTEVVTWNTPTFPKEYPWGEDMPEAKEMERLFHEVVGPPTKR